MLSLDYWETFFYWEKKLRNLTKFDSQNPHVTWKEKTDFVKLSSDHGMCTHTEHEFQPSPHARKTGTFTLSFSLHICKMEMGLVYLPQGAAVRKKIKQI